MLRKYFAGLLWLILVQAVPQVFAQQPPTDEEGHEWWQHAVFYEIYPRSFADSNNDGIGDLNGITSKLGYLRELGVDAIWITPCFPSPQIDFGYDVSDYVAIDPMYGTLQDFDRLATDAKQRNIRIIFDLVVNHTSDQHKWFIDSRSSRTSEHRDWYIWRDGKGPGIPPNNWVAVFGTPAWTLDKTTNQYYYHYFYPQQPDLNWRNPDVEKAMLDVTRFWYKRGVAGFRLDAVDTLYEDPALRDNPIAPGMDRFGRPNTFENYNKRLPEVHDALRKLRHVADEYGAVLIGETWTINVGELSAYYGVKNDELQMPMDLMMTGLHELSAGDYRKHIALVDSAGHWPVYVITNHDIVRSYTRLGDGKHNDQIAKMMGAMYLTLRGAAIMYYGEELGMANNDPVRKEDVQDPIGKLGWPVEKGRDGERTPMQWNAGLNAGFSTAKPWLPIPASAKTHNVASEQADPDSIWRFYQKLLALRHSEAALLDGKYVPLNENDPNVLAYARKYKEEVVVVLLNMSASEQTIKPDLLPLSVAAPQFKVLLASSPDLAPSASGEWKLQPYAAVLLKMSR